ncbi:MAG: FAD-dependent oxidoreductase [Porcipelethomonas sp.]
MKTEALIIGGGITGILTGFFLHQKGVPYVLVEKDRICSGTTGSTTAKITFQHGLIYDKLMRSGGTEKAAAYLRANQAAFNKYTELCSSIQCDFERRDNYVYSVGDKEKLFKEMEALLEIGYDARFCENLPLPMKTAGAVCFPDQAQFNPLKFLASIAKNLKIYEHTHVREMEGTTAVTDYGKIYARKVVVATHFPFINMHGSYFLKLYQNRSYVAALENAQDVNGMYMDECQTGFSFRNYGDLLFVGGGAHRTGKQKNDMDKLKNFIKEKYPDAREKYFWAAQDCMSLDSVPYIGKYSANTPDMYTASGFNKWGMTGAMLSAMLLSDMVCEVKNEFADIFTPSRSILKPQLFVNGFEAVKNLLTPTGKRCPHLGCALKWNASEHTWDCPCHGSRFEANGKVLDNPANGDLKK